MENKRPYLTRDERWDRPGLQMKSGKILPQLVGFHFKDGTEVQYSRNLAIELGLVAEALVPLCSMLVSDWVIINNQRFLKANKP